MRIDGVPVRDVGGVHVMVECDPADVALVSDSGKKFAMDAANQAGHMVNALTNIVPPLPVDKTTGTVLNSQDQLAACQAAGNLVYRTRFSFTFAGA